MSLACHGNQRFSNCAECGGDDDDVATAAADDDDDDGVVSPH